MTLGGGDDEVEGGALRPVAVVDDWQQQAAIEDAVAGVAGLAWEVQLAGQDGTVRGLTLTWMWRVRPGYRPGTTVVSV